MIKDRTFHDLFDEWNEYSAYIFGFWYADGCITINKKGHRSYKRFCISSTDEDIVRKISEYLGKNYSSRMQSVGGVCKGRGSKSIHRLQINSDKMFDFCYSITGRDKTNQGCFPDIPKNFLRHFIRGFFDGDGSIHETSYKNRHGRISTNIRSYFCCGLEASEFLECLNSRLSNFGVHGIMSKSGKTYRLKLNQYNTYLLCKLIYDDSKIKMDRKFEIWESCDKNKMANSRKYQK